MKMHTQLQAVFPWKFAIGGGALWCAWMLAAVLAHSFRNNAPLPAPAEPPQPFKVVVRTIPMMPDLAFDDRWQAPEPAMPHTDIAEEAAPPPAQIKPDHIKPKHVESHAELRGNVCTRHHMRKVVTRGGKSWRCRR